MHALRNIHTTLAPGGVLVDTQPVSPYPRVATDGNELGALNMREWLDTIRAVDGRVLEAVGAGLFEIQHEEQLAVVDAFDDGSECLAIAGNWRETQVPQTLYSRLETTHGRVTVEQDVRLRLLRCAAIRR